MFIDPRILLRDGRVEYFSFFFFFSLHTVVVDGKCNNIRTNVFCAIYRVISG